MGRYPHVCLEIKPALSTQSDFTIAIAAVHRFIATRFKGYFGILSAIGACYGKHLARGTIAVSAITIAVATVPVPLCFPCLTAFGAAFGLISIAPGLEKLLILNAESEGSPTIGTLECLVLKTHWMTSSLLLVG